MSISYSTNWMGPVSLDWYKRRGLLITKKVVLDDNHFHVRYGNGKSGDVMYVEEITDRWSGGRIDVYGTDSPYPEEIGLPVMRDEDWHRFTAWLETFKTDDVWTLEQLVEFYERKNPKIVWDKDVA